MVRPNGIITKIGWGPQPRPTGRQGRHPARLLQPTPTPPGSGPGLLSSGQINLEPVIGEKTRPAASTFSRMDAGENVKSVVL